MSTGVSMPGDAAGPPDGNTGWQPLSPGAVAAEMDDFDRPWWITGGWAIDLHLGRHTRPHEDIDIGVFRRDQGAVWAHLARWELWATDPPGELRLWTGDDLGRGVTGVWCRRGAGRPWSLQLLFDESDHDLWVYRRLESIRRPAASIALHTEEGIPYMAPDVALLSKAKYRRPKDDADLAAVIDVLTDAQRVWLRDALLAADPGHHWIEEL